MFFIFSRLRLSVHILIALLFGMLGLLAGCGGGNELQSTPIPDSPRAYKGPGNPIGFFGGGEKGFRPGANDPEYQEYLLWKEWKEYQRYQEFLKTQGKESITEQSEESQ